MRAILLAAGRGRRLEHDGPKCLVSIEGKTLLERHVANLCESAVKSLVLVVGYERAQIDAALARFSSPIPITVVENKDFHLGSILSLQVAAAHLENGGLWMDADVLYPVGLMRRLVGSAHENCVLVDTRADETGEEMMIGIRGGRARRIARRVGPGWDVRGESVGFFKVGPEGGRAMKRILDEEIAAGRADQEHEAALDRAFDVVPFGFERVDDFEWTEIDFPADVERARGIARSLHG